MDLGIHYPYSELARIYCRTKLKLHLYLCFPIQLTIRLQNRKKHKEVGIHERSFPSRVVVVQRLISYFSLFLH